MYARFYPDFSPMSSIASEVNGASGISEKESNSSAESKNDTQIQDEEVHKGLALTDEQKKPSKKQALQMKKFKQS